MKKVKEFLKDLWLLAKGNKTIFLQAVWIAVEVGLIPITGPWLLFVRGLIGLLTTGALYDHAKSGHFSTKKLVEEK